MKQSQWGVAALVLALTVFFVTFAMNYLGEGGRGVAVSTTPRQPRHEVLFFWRTSPAASLAFEYEMHVPGHQDFWFRNDNREAVKIGLFKKGCKCTSIDLFYLPEDGPGRLIADAVALLGTAMNGPLASPGALTPAESPAGSTEPAPIKPTVTLSTLALHALTMSELQKGASGPHELLRLTDSVSVPAGAVGWVRMHWKGERIGRQTLNAELWMDDPDGNTTTLETRIRIQDPLRVQPVLSLGVLRDEALATGVTRDILCWSSTRTSLRLQTQTSQPRDNPASDTFVVGKPVPMTAAEIHNLENQNALGSSENEGPVLCGYRIPVTIKGMAADGKTPFDLGPFLRRVTVSSPDAPGEPKQVTVTGRVRGDIDFGNDENGEINFSSFSGRTGKRMMISLQSDVPGLKLTLDRKRTPEFLTAVVGKPETIKGGVRQVWSLRAEVLPGKMWGVFPRRDDPLYEDSAIYLKADVPGKPPRSVRIAVQGTANQS